jgi:hypothetical protein
MCVWERRGFWAPTVRRSVEVASSSGEAWSHAIIVQRPAYHGQHESHRRSLELLFFFGRLAGRKSDEVGYYMNHFDGWVIDQNKNSKGPYDRVRILVSKIEGCGLAGKEGLDGSCCSGLTGCPLRVIGGRC